jgi:nitroreductase
MDFIQLAKERFSSRKYKQQLVESEKLKIVLEAGRIAPSAVNFQPWVFIVVNGENIEKLRDAYQRDWFKTASLYIVLCADHSKSWKRVDGKDHADIDLAISATHMVLAATSIGLATCMVCNFDKDKLILALNLPINLEPIFILPLGYPDDVADPGRHEVKRKPLDDMVFYDIYK